MRMRIDVVFEVQRYHHTKIQPSAHCNWLPSHESKELIIHARQLRATLFGLNASLVCYEALYPNIRRMGFSEVA
jgi:hypothetical protein